MIPEVLVRLDARDVWLTGGRESGFIQVQVHDSASRERVVIDLPDDDGARCLRDGVFGWIEAHTCARAMFARATR